MLEATAAASIPAPYFAASFLMRASAMRQAPSEASRSPRLSSGTRILAISKVMAARFSTPRS